MRLRILAVAAAMLAGPAEAAPGEGAPAAGTFRISGVAYEMPVPGGYCLPSGRQVDAAQLLAAADKQNVTQLTMFSCPAAGEDYILVKTPTAALVMDVSREDLLKALGTAFDDPKFSLKQVLPEAGKDITAVMKQKVDLTGEVKPRGRDEACAYLGGTVEVKAPTMSYRISVGGCMTAVGRRVLTVFVYAPDRGAPGVAALMVRSRRLMETIRVVPAG